jgi:hypothetical protein
MISILVRVMAQWRSRTYCDNGFPLSVEAELDGDIDNVIPEIVCVRNVVQ